jgi:hypothetical protein
MRLLARKILPVMLIAIGVWLLSGCIYVPMLAGQSRVRMFPNS